MQGIDRDQGAEIMGDIEDEGLVPWIARSRVDRGTFLKVGGAAAALAALAGLPEETLAKPGLSKDFGLIEITAAATVARGADSATPRLVLGA